MILQIIFDRETSRFSRPTNLNFLRMYACGTPIFFFRGGNRIASLVYKDQWYRNVDENSSVSKFIHTLFFLNKGSTKGRLNTWTSRPFRMPLRCCKWLAEIKFNRITLFVKLKFTRLWDSLIWKIILNISGRMATLTEQGNHSDEEKWGASRDMWLENGWMCATTINLFQ